MSGFGRRNSGGGVVTTVPDTATQNRLAAVESAVAAKQDTSTAATDTELATALTGKADQTALDALSTASATKTELAAVETKVDDHIANHPDVKLQSAVRQADGSILLTMSDTTEITVGAPAAVDLSEYAKTVDVDASQALQDTALDAKADQSALDAEIASTDAEQAAQDTAIAAKADQAALDAEIASTNTEQAAQDALITPLTTQDPINKAHIANADIHVAAGGSALQLYRRTADGTGYEWADLTISSSNTVSGVGAPSGPLTDDAGYFYLQLDAELGTNDIWGPSVAGTPATWPAQADYKSADPETGALTDFDDDIEKVKPKSWKAEDLDSRYLFPVVYKTGGEQAEIGKENHYYQDDAPHAQPTPELGKEYGVHIIKCNRADAATQVEKPAVDVYHWRAVDLGNGPVWLATDAPEKFAASNVHYVRRGQPALFPDQFAGKPYVIFSSVDNQDDGNGGIDIDVTRLDIHIMNADDSEIDLNDPVLPTGQGGGNWVVKENETWLAEISGTRIQLRLISEKSDSSGPLPRETIQVGDVVANTFTPQANYYSWLGNAGVADGDTVTMPDLSVYDSANEKRGVIHNISGVKLPVVAFTGQTLVSVPDNIEDGSALEWRQTGPGFVTGYIAGTSRPTENRVEIPVTNANIRNDVWAVQNLGFNPTTNQGRLIIETDLGDIEIELPMRTGKQYHSGVTGTAPTHNVRALYHSGNTVSIASSTSSTAGTSTTTLRRIWHYKGKAEIAHEIEDSETVLIDVDATNNTFYQFSTTETWAQIKANYERLIITGNASRIGSNQIRPWSFILDLTSHPVAFSQSGYRIDLTNDYNVTVYVNIPTDINTGFTYRQSGGDLPFGGRMQFKVVGVKKIKKAVGQAVVQSYTSGIWRVQKVGDQMTIHGTWSQSNSDTNGRTLTFPESFAGASEWTCSVTPNSVATTYKPHVSGQKVGVNRVTVYSAYSPNNGSQIVINGGSQINIIATGTAENPAVP